MDMANHGFLGTPAGASKQIDDRIAEALHQQGLRNAAARALLHDLRVGLHGGDSGAQNESFLPEREPAFDPFGASPRGHGELFLAGPGRKKAGERRRQILAGFVEMLGTHKSERITTALLARYLDSSEAAIYRHFESRSVMFESLIATIENAVFDQAAQLQLQCAREPEDRARHAGLLVSQLLDFAESNPGISRVMAGDALALEDDFLRLRMTGFFDRFESTLAAALRGDADEAVPVQRDITDTGPDRSAVVASALAAFCVGRLALFARSGFCDAPSAGIDACLATMLR